MWQAGTLRLPSLLCDKQLPAITMTIQEADSLTVTIIADNYYDALVPDPPIGKRRRALPYTSVHAEHGFSCLIECVRGNESTCVFFDFGLDPIGVLNNIDLLGIELDRIDAFVLSHGHFDHWGGLLTILGRAHPGVPLYVGDEAFAQRFSSRPGSADLIDLGRLDRKAIEELGIVEIVEVKGPVEVNRGCYLSGEIERRTDYEKGGANLIIQRGDDLIQDHFPGEQAIVCAVKEKGLVVISGCAHAGIVNTIYHAQRITGIQKVHAVIGGFHLVNATEGLIEKTVADMVAISPDYIIPAHCTGFAAIIEFAHALPDQFILNTAATRYQFGEKKER